LFKSFIRNGIILFFLILLFGGVSLANGDEVETSDYTVEQEWEQEEGEDLRVLLTETFRPARFYYNYGLGYLNLREIGSLNERTPTDFPQLENGMLVRRWSYVFGFREVWRIGWVKTHGSQDSSTGTGDDFRRISYNLEMAGVLVEKCVYLDSLLDIAIGVAGGRGNHQVNLLFSGPHVGTGDNPWQEPVSSNLSQTFFFLQPQINGKLRLGGPFIANLQAGYTLTAGRDRWTVEGEEVRDERFKTDGFHFSAGFGVRF